MRITVTRAVWPCYSSYFLRSRHGESAYIIEQDWNLVVNRPHFRSYLIGQGSFDWVTLIGLSHIRVSTHVSTAYRDTKGTSHVRRRYVGIRSSYSSIRSSYAEVLRFFMCALKNS